MAGEDCGHDPPSPPRCARTIASARLPTSNFAKIECNVLPTVLGERNSWSAIVAGCAHRRPAGRRTSRSRAVSSGNGSACRGRWRDRAADHAEHPAATPGPKMTSPATTARSARSDLVLIGPLEQVAAARRLHAR